jgi:hypothetical protein
MLINYIIPKIKFVISIIIIIIIIISYLFIIPAYFLSNFVHLHLKEQIHQDLTHFNLFLNLFLYAIIFYWNSKNLSVYPSF